MIIKEKDFIHNGMRCIVIMTEMGHRCGYVGIRENHKLYELPYGDKSKHLPLRKVKNQPKGKRGVVPMFFHFLENPTERKYLSPDIFFDVHGGITFSGQLKIANNDNLWWFGYDCAHNGDANDLSVVSESIKEIKLRYPTDGVLRTVQYCMDECRSLADQLSKIGEERRNRIMQWLKGWIKERG